MACSVARLARGAQVAIRAGRAGSLEAIAGPDIAIAEGRFATGARLGARAGSATLRGKKNETERSDDHRHQHTSKTVPDSFPLRCGSRAERGLFRRRGSRVKTLLVDRRQPSKCEQITCC